MAKQGLVLEVLRDTQHFRKAINDEEPRLDGRPIKKGSKIFVEVTGEFGDFFVVEDTNFFGGIKSESLLLKEDFKVLETEEID